MGRGKLSEKTVRERSLAKALEWMQATGVNTEEIAQIEIAEPAETSLDKIKEAEACLIYFSTKGFRFKQKVCKTCEETFAYRWEVDSITRCSVDCYKKALEEIGLKWTPGKPQSERWGPSAPVVVPPAALKILKDRLNDSLEDQPDDTYQQAGL